MAENSNNSNGAAPPEPAPQSGGTEGPSLKDFLDFDPFEPSSGSAAEGQAKEPADTGAQAPPATEAAGDALPPKSEQQPQGSTAPRAAEDPVLRELARINETLAASQQYAAQAAYAPPQPTAQSAGPRFNLEIPQQILKAVIHSEDPEERAMGLAALVNGLANTLYNDISSEFRASQQQLYSALPQVHQHLTREQSEQQRAASDFFGRFTTLRPTRQMMELVAGEAKALAMEQWRAGHRNLQWDENFREALGQRIHAGLGLPFPQRGVAPPAQQGAIQRAPKRAQFASGGDAKGGNERRAPNAEMQEIWDVFNYN
jgi:hypothetical protein